jgi:hypothetical protein
MSINLKRTIFFIYNFVINIRFKIIKINKRISGHLGFFTQRSNPVQLLVQPAVVGGVEAPTEHDDMASNADPKMTTRLA